MQSAERDKRRRTIAGKLIRIKGENDVKYTAHRRHASCRRRDKRRKTSTKAAAESQSANSTPSNDAGGKVTTYYVSGKDEGNTWRGLNAV